jgi:DUF1680 family protein
MTLTTRTVSAPVVPERSILRPLGVTEVHITGGFWGDRQAVNGTATLAHIEHWLEREGWLGNFDLAAAGTLPEGRRGREFSDSEIYKYLEAVAWEIGRVGGHDALEMRFRAVVDRVAAAQEPDGYLNTRFGRDGQGARWSALEWGHELYCLGHLFQAAVARERTAPGSDDGLLQIACRSADLVCEVFGPEGMQSVCGHPEIETGLAELGRVTGERRYLDQAALFIERRGHGTLQDIEWGRSYFQDDIPVRESEVLRGHAVRANYLAAGAMDVAMDNNDTELRDALTRQWDRTVERRTYVTGGQGSHHQDEAFGEDWELPSDRAYSETCAGIASIMFSWRLLLEHNDVRYSDLIERTLFNVLATSPSQEGTAFFYANTLHQRTPGLESSANEISSRASSSLRAPWFEVSCCPPNVARTFASLAGYVATVNDGGLQIHQFAPATINTVLPDGRAVAVEIATDYPRDGVIAVRIIDAPDTAMTLSLRVPAWAESAQLRFLPAAGAHDSTAGAEASTGTEATAGAETTTVGAGYASVERAFVAGDVVELSLLVRPRIIHPDPRIDAIRGTVAIERGPEVFCLESVDVNVTADEFSLLALDSSVDPVETAGGVTVALRRMPIGATGTGEVTDTNAEHRTREGGGEGVDAAGSGSFKAKLVPYNSWAERGPSTMRVWLPTVVG